MDLLIPLSDGVYVLFNQLLEYLNEHSAKQGYTVIIKQSKKSKRQRLRKVWLKCNKGRGKDICQTLSRRDEYSWKAVATQDAKLETWSFQIDNLEHKHPLTLPGANPTHRKKAMTDNVKMTIVSQTQVNSSARQILAPLRLGIDEENQLFKPKDIYNQRAYQRQV